MRAWLLILLAGCGRFGFAEDHVAGDAVVADVSIDSMPDAPDRPNRAFISSATHDGALGGTAAADATCQMLAMNAGLPGTFIALLQSSTRDPLMLMAGSRGWVDVTGMPIADQPGDWLGGMIDPLIRDEHGTHIGYEIAWIGFGAGTCMDWTSNATADHGGVAETVDVFDGYTFGSCAGASTFACVELGHVADVVPAPATGRVAFISHAAWTPGGGLAGADGVCMSEAGAAGLGGTFRAALATPAAGPLARFGSGLPWRRVDGVRLAPGADALIGATPAMFLDSFAAREASGARTEASVWTGTTAENCASWQATTGTGMAGDGASVDLAFLLGIISASCSETRNLLCLEL